MYLMHINVSSPALVIFLRLKFVPVSYYFLDLSISNNI